MPTIRKKVAKGKSTRWQDSVRFPPHPDGTPNRPTVYGKTRAEVQAKADALRADRDRGVDPRKGKQTLAAYLTDWANQSPPLTRKGRPLDDRTWATYQQITRDFLIPHLGQHKLAKLTAGAVEDMSAALVADGYAPSYATKVCEVLSKALGRAERDGLVPRNVVHLAVLPDRTAPEKDRPTNAHIRQLLATVVDDPDEVLIHLLVKTGLRRGEALAVRWCDLDLESGTLAVLGTVERRPNPKRDHPDEPRTQLWRKPRAKTKASIRVIALAPSLVPLLRRRKDEQRLERIACEKVGTPWASPDGLVFTNPTGGVIDPRTFFERYKALCHRAGWPEGFTFHDLRHANLTAMVTSNLVDPKTAQAMAGHADVKMTLQYVHTDLDLQHAAAAKLDALYRASEDAA